MVNFGLNSASLLGIFLAVAGASLYFLRSVRPELSRDQDIFFAAVGLLCGFILLFQGWRLDPILQFGQFLLTGTTVFFAIETIRLRGVATEQARRNTPIVDKDRPVSDRVRVYREAELDQIEPYDDTEEDYDNRRLRGYPEPRSSRQTSYEEAPRTPRSRPASDRYSPRPASRSPRRRPNPPGDRYSKRDLDRRSEEDFSSSTPSRRSRPNFSSEPPSRPSRRRRPRPSNLDATPTDYVDYQPVNESGSEWNQPERGRRPELEGRDRDRNSQPDFDY